MNILVTGATGALGEVVTETLLTQLTAQQISVLTRNDEKAAAFRAKGFKAYLGDYTDVASLQNAMDGVDTVLLISAGDQGNRVQEHRNVIDAAKRMGVGCIAYTSRSLKDRATLKNKLMLDHFDTEDYIKASGLTYTIFQNALYMDVIPLFVGGQVFETGIFQPAGDGKVAFALRGEQGEAMANVLINEGCNNQVYRFTGSEAYSFYNVASALTELTGKDIHYTPVDVPDYEKTMKDKGLPPLMVQKIIDFNTDIKAGQEEEVTPDLERHLGRKPASLKEGLKIAFNL